MSAYVIVDAELTRQITVGKDVSSRVQFRLQGTPLLPADFELRLLNL
jgi:hypothetical protein